MPSCRTLLDQPRCGALNMALDEVFLERAAAQERAHLRLYTWSEPTLSLGYFQTIGDRQQHVSSRTCAVVRRPSGGGAILHDREITYAVALPGAWRARQQRQLYRGVHEAIAQLLDRLGASPRVCQNTTTNHFQEPFLCFRRHTEGDILMDGCKVAGSAQRRGKGAILQHGSILLSRSQFAPELLGIEDLSAIRLTDSQWMEHLAACILKAIGRTAKKPAAGRRRAVGGSVSCGSQTRASRLVCQALIFRAFF